MNDISCRKIKTGSDPRTLPDYAVLRDELSKLTHPARPDVNWHYVEKRCLSLFEHNGVELQTAAWYTLARAQLAGLCGLNEGLAILEALISHQWGALWPQPVHARMEILSTLSQRLQQRMRSLPLNYSDLGQLYRAEQLLNNIGAVLQRLELKHLSQFDILRTLMHNCAVRLENSDDTASTGPAIQSGIVFSSTVMNGAGISTGCHVGRLTEDTRAPDSAVKWVYVAQPEQQPKVEVLSAMPDPVKKWKFFIAGMCTMLVISTVAVGSWHYVHRPDPLQTQLVASLALLPAPLTPEQLDMLRQQSSLPQTGITQTQQQLARLNKLPPDWNITYSRKLTEQAQSLWPEQTTTLVLEWQRQLNASALPLEAMDGWHQGMTKLKQLSNRLNGLDEQKGKYMTVSELKTAVFSAIESFNRSVPTDEQLRVLSLVPPEQPLPAAAQAQLKMHLKQLIARYALLTQPEMQRITDRSGIPNE